LAGFAFLLVRFYSQVLAGLLGDFSAAFGSAYEAYL
jgi:hypothetical protein